MRELGGLALIAVTWMTTGSAYAAPYRACFQVPYQGYFTDDDVGEDHHGGWYKPRGMQAVIKTTGGTTVFSGNLSSQGCATFDDGRPAGTAYNITYTSKVTFSNGDYVAVYGPSVPTDRLSTPAMKSNMDTFVKTSASEMSYQFPIASAAPDPAPEHKVATLFSFAAVSRGWQAKPKTRVYLGVDGSGGTNCTTDGVLGSGAGTCCTEDSVDANLCKIEVGTSFLRSKFTMMHEYGHAVAHRITSTGAWTGGSNDCSKGGSGYTMTSHEYMGCAANEGFADFVSTSVFNDPAWGAVYSRNGIEYWMLDDWRQCGDDYYGGDPLGCVNNGEGTRQGWMRTWWAYSLGVTRSGLEDEVACAYNWGRHDLVDNIQECMSSTNLSWFNDVLGAVGP